MKKLFLISLLTLLQTFTNAQKVSIGPELGMNIIPIENENLGRNFQMGFHIGAHLKYHISDNFRISTGLFITQKKKMYLKNDTSSVFELFGDFIQFTGMSEEELDSMVAATGANTDVTEETKGIVTETFINIPILANYKYKNLNLYLGPYAGFLLTANRKEETRTQIPLLNVFDISQFDSTGFASAFLPPADETNSSQTSGKNGLNSVDIGMIAGIGYEMNNLHFNLMYSQGFLDYRSEQGEEDLSPLNTFRFSIVYLFDLKPNIESTPRID